MATKKILSVFGLIFGISFLFASLFFNILNVHSTQANALTVSQNDATSTDLQLQSIATTNLLNQPYQPETNVATACGAGEQLPPWTICIHGFVWFHESESESVPLDGIDVSVSSPNGIVTGLTSIHPGNTQPTYGIDISPLESDFLTPITVSATYNGHIYSQQVLLFPDFTDYSQQVDIHVLDFEALNPGVIEGQVFDYASGGPVAGAEVTAEFDANSIVVTTTMSPLLEIPIYRIGDAELSYLGANSGDIITLTARYADDSDQKIIQIPEEEIQLDFSTGWKCDGYDPLPDFSSGDGLPDFSSGDGLPDIACFWGAVYLNSTPIENVLVNLEVSGTIYSAYTQQVDGELIPRYNISISGNSFSDGQVVTATATISGYTNIQTMPINLDTGHSQQIDMALSEAGLLADFANGNVVRAIKATDTYVWTGTDTGVVRWNKQDGSYTQITVADGLVHNRVTDLDIASDGSIWIGTYGGISKITATDDQLQIENIASINGSNINGIYALKVAPDQSIWVAWNSIPGQPMSVTQYVPGNPVVWNTYSPGQGLPNDSIPNIFDIAFDADGNIWLANVQASEPGLLVRFRGDTNFVFATNSSFPSSVASLAVTNDGKVWIGGWDGMLVLYDLFSTPTFTTRTFGSSSLEVDVSADGEEIWVTSEFGAYRGNLATNGQYSWTNACCSPPENLRDLAVDPNGAVWFSAFDDITGFGLFHYDPNSDPIWSLFEVDNTPSPHSPGGDIYIADDGSVWITRGGISHYSPLQENPWQIFNLSNSPIETAHSLVIDNNNWVWVSTELGLYKYVPETDTWEGPIFHTASARMYTELAYNPLDNSFWMLSYSNGLATAIRHYSPDKASSWEAYGTEVLPSVSVNDIQVSSSGHIWFATQNGVVRHIPGENPIWETFTSELPNLNARSIKIVSDDSIWIGALDVVVHFTPGIGDEWEHFSTSDGLSSGLVWDIEVSSDGTVWFATGNGLSRFSPNGSPVWTTFTTVDGLSSSDVRSIAATNDGTLWVSTTGGIDLWGSAVSATDLDLQVVQGGLPLPDKILTYTVSLQNVGEIPAVAPIISATLPIEMQLVTSSITPTTVTPLTWQLPSLAESAQTVLTFTTQISSEIAAGTPYSVALLTTSSSPENFTNNNQTTFSDIVRDPEHADVRVSIQGPPNVPVGNEAQYRIWIDNYGGLPAENTQVNLQLDANLAFVSANPPPTSLNPITWEFGELPGFSTPMSIFVTTTASANIDPGTLIDATATITTTSIETNGQNNISLASIPTTNPNAETIFLVAPDRMTSKFGASQLMHNLYGISNHPKVQGVVLDVMTDAAVVDAYNNWDGDLGSWQLANEVAESIKILIERELENYPNLKYIVFVGGDDIVPFYRVPDRSQKFWRESTYAANLTASTTQAALAANMLLTDDFYTDLSPIQLLSPYWEQDYTLYLPDLVSSRLVETPDEIHAVLTAFIENNGVVRFETAVAGYLPNLTKDWGEAQCEALAEAGMDITCSDSGVEWYREVVEEVFDSYWLTVHGNHYSVGPLYAYEIEDIPFSLSNSVFVNFSCHGGLNDPNSVFGIWPDIPQSVLGKGGTYIGATTYTFAGRHNIYYAELLSRLFNDAIFSPTALNVGEALVQAKHAYYAQNGYWFGALDEKTLVPVTLYGLPMVEIEVPESLQRQPQPLNRDDMQITSTQTGDNLILSIDLDGLEFNKNNVDDGVYYDFQGQTISPDGLPVQPYYSFPIEQTLDSQTVRGIYLEDGGYFIHEEFDPVIGDSFVLGETGQVSFLEPNMLASGWDHELPFSMVQSGGAGGQIWVNFSLGAFNSIKQIEHLYHDLNLRILYSDHPDTTAPSLLSWQVTTFDGGLFLDVEAADNESVEQVVGVCDDGAGNLSSFALTETTPGTWQGHCNEMNARAFVQIIDIGGNVFISDWVSPNAPNSIYLPMILK